MTNGDKLLIKLQEAKKSFEEFAERITKGEKLAETLSELGADWLFCRGCGDEKEKVDAGACEKCAKDWLEEEENEKNNHGGCGGDDSHCFNSNGSC